MMSSREGHRPAATWSALVWCAIAVQAAITLTYAATLHYTFKTSAYDIATYTQAMHNFFEGRGLFITIHAPPKSLFAGHFFPLFYTLAPFYALWPDEMVFRIANVLLLALAAFPLYHCALHVTRHAPLSFVLALAYLFSPFVVNAAVWDFHEIAFAAPIFACTYLALLRARRGGFLVGCALLMMTKEHYGLAIAGFGLLWGWCYKEYRFGLWLAASGLAVTGFMLGVVIPSFSDGGVHFMLKGEERYGWILDPFNNLPMIALLILGALPYLALLGIGGLFAGFFAWRWLLPGIADLAVNLASLYPMMRSPYSYHSAALMIVFTVAVAQGAMWMMARNPRLKPRDAIITLAMVTAVLLYDFGNLPGAANMWEFGKPQLALKDEDAKNIRAVTQLIPEDEALAAQHNLAPHFAMRRTLHHFPESVGDAAWIVLRLDFPFRQRLQVFGAPYQVPCKDYVPQVYGYLRNPEWTVAYWNPPWLVLRHGGEDTGAPRRDIEAAVQAVESVCHSLKGRYLL